MATTENTSSTPAAAATPIHTTPVLTIDNIDGVLAPIGASGRVKYTCFDISRRYLVLGANTGSLYFFERKQNIALTNETLQSNFEILSLNDIRDSIFSIKLAPYNDNLVAVATNKVIFVIEPNLAAEKGRRRDKEKILFKMTDHPRETEITTVVWSSCGNYLFTGDDGGNIYCSSVPKARRAFFFSAELVVKCDSRIVQMDVIPTTVTDTVSILASSLTKSVVINYTISPSISGKVLSQIQVGKKLREKPTKQGACYHSHFNQSIYASRPGRRIWLADPIEGKVLSTMNFKSGGEEGAVVVAPIPLSTDPNSPMLPVHAMSFAKLLPYGTNLISWDEKSLLFIDLNEVEVMEWRVDSTMIQDICITENSIYILHGQHRSISRVYSQALIATMPVLPIPAEVTAAADQQQQHINHKPDLIVEQHQPQQQPQESIQPSSTVTTPTNLSTPVTPQQQPLNNTLTLSVDADDSLKDSNTYSDQNSNKDTDVSSQIDSLDTNSLTNSTSSLTMIDENDQQHDINSSPVVTTVVSSTPTPTPTPPTPTPTTNIITPPTPSPVATTTSLPPQQQQQQQPVSHIRNTSKENIFAEIEVNTNPLITTTSSGVTRKIIKKKKVKPSDSTTNLLKTSGSDAVTPPSSTIVVADQTTPSSSPTATPKDPSNSSSLNLFEESSSQPKIEPSLDPKHMTTTIKRTVVKKKLIKKEKAPSTNSTPDSSTPDKPPSPVKPDQQTTTPAVVAQQPVVAVPPPTAPAAQQPVTPIQQTTATVVSPNQQQQPVTLNQTQNHEIQQPISAAASKASGIFKGLSTSIESIQQKAITKLQKQTSEIKSEISNITQKLPLSMTFGSNNSTPVSSTPPTMEPISENTNESISQAPTIAAPTPEPVPEPTPMELLEKLTKGTFDSWVIYKFKRNEKAFFPMLQIWVQAFHKVEYVPPSEMINEIITGCFLCGINLLSHDPTGKLCMCWNENTARETIRKYFSYLDCNKIYPYVNEKQWDSCIDTLLEVEAFSNQALIKTISTLNTYIDNSDCTACIHYLENHKGENGLLFRYMENIFELQPKAAAQFYSKQYPIILPRNIMKIVNMNPGNRLPYKFEYLNQLMSIVEECRYDSNLVEEWFMCNLAYQQPPKDQLFTAEKRPRVGAYNIEWKNNEQLKSIISGVLTNDYQCNLNTLESLCESNGYFEGLLIIYLHYYKQFSSKSVTFDEKASAEYAQKLINLVVSTDNVAGLTNIMENNIDVGLWSMLVQKMHELRDYYFNIFYSRENKFAISEILVASMMGRSIGPLQTIDILISSPLFENTQIPSQLLSEWIKNGKWALYNRKSISHEILSRLDSYLWTKKPMNLSPQIWSLVDQDFNNYHSPNSIRSQQQLNQQSQISDPIASSISSSTAEELNLGITPQFFEDSSFHWGTETELHSGQCPICTLPLVENPESTFVGVTPSSVVVFPYCGHSYHQYCIEEQGCLLCYSQKR